MSKEEYGAIVADFCAFMSGQSGPFIREIEQQMRAAARDQRYEEAARLRDRLGALTRATERNAVVFSDSTDADVIALADDPLEAGVQVFHVRGGRIRGERSFILEKAEELPPSGYMERVLQRLYAESAGDDIPREVLVSTELADGWADWLGGLRGAQVDIRRPQRGDKRALMETATANAAQALAQHKLRRTGDLTTRSRALQELQDALGLAEAPLRIECIDISTLQGTDTVASLVVFEDGLPRTKDYRSYGVRTPGADDTAAVAEVVARRFAVRESAEAGEEAPGRTAYPPSLLVIDGGQPQVRAAQEALLAAGAWDVPVIGLAKRLEEVWLADEPDPVILPRTSEGLYLLQRIRDEAHRTAIALHRKRRGRRTTASALDDIPGLGPARAKALLRAFGSVARIRAAGVLDLQQVPGIGPALAETIHGRLNPSEEQS